MKTTIDINSTVTKITPTVIVSQDTPAVPAVGDDISLPSPIAAPMPNQFQQLTVSNRIFRYTTDGAGIPNLLIVLVTDDPIA
jgi:hypothetical protein